MDRRELIRVFRKELRKAVISAAVGALVTVFYGMGQREGVSLIFMLSGAFVGVCIYAAISLLSRITGRWTALLPRRVAVIAEGVKYVVGGLIGWWTGIGIVSLVFSTRAQMPSFNVPARQFMLVIVALTLGIGLMFRAFEVMEQRLRQREWAERELDIARSIQERLLPPAVITGAGFTVSGRNLAAHYVAGDFYDVVPLEDGSVMIVLADVAGKGIGAGLIMSSVKAVLPFVAREGVAQTMSALNQKLGRELGKREFVALVCVRYQPDTGVIEVANGGCPDPYVLRANVVEMVSCEGIRLPLGLNQNIEYTIATRRMEPGDRLVLLSDGIPEAPTPDGLPLGYTALEGILNDLSQVPERSTAWIDRLIGEVKQRVGTTLTDDWTALILERAAA